MIIYIFTAGHEIGVTTKSDASDLPRPKGGDWKSFLQMPSAEDCAMAGFDYRAFRKTGFQVIERDQLVAAPVDDGPVRMRPPRDRR